MEEIKHIIKYIDINQGLQQICMKPSMNPSFTIMTQKNESSKIQLKTEDKQKLIYPYVL